MGPDVEVGPDGWGALRKAVCSPGAAQPLWSVEAPVRVMIEGRREDLRAIWVQLALRFVVETHCRKGFVDFFYRDGGDVEEDWRELLVFLTEDLGYCCQECTPAFDGLG